MPCATVSAERLKNQSLQQLLVDVSVIIRSDARTGIQRAVRALLLQLVQMPPHGFCICPIFASKRGGYYYAPPGFGTNEFDGSAGEPPSKVEVKAGDVFLGLDLAANILPMKCVNIAIWKSMGVEIHVVVYDLLPVLHPEWFNHKTTVNFRRWLRAIALLADNVICISNVVAKDFTRWVSRYHGISADQIQITVFPLGADIESTLPNSGLPNYADSFLKATCGKPTALMVGTLEPRKGYAEILDAFELLWRRGSDVNLVVVGKAGWKTEALQRRLQAHPELNTRLYWLDSVSDELLEAIYGASTGLIAASFNEGFGLPIIEAARYKKPVLARDIEVFREIAGHGVTFFNDKEPTALADSIMSWLQKSGDPSVSLPATDPKTWYQSSRNLLACMRLDSSTDTEASTHEQQPVG